MGGTDSKSSRSDKRLDGKCFFLDNIQSIYNFVRLLGETSRENNTAARRTRKLVFFTCGVDDIIVYNRYLDKVFIGSTQYFGTSKFV